MPIDCAQDQLDEMKKWDVVLLNNLEMADKLPPTRSVGQFPEDFYAVCSDGDVFQKLKNAMPNVPAMASAFDSVAKQTVEPKPDMNWLYNPDKRA